MPYRPTQARYSGGGKVKYLLYNSAQRLRSGRMQPRTRVKRVYFPANARDIRIDAPKVIQKRTGKHIYGVAVHYRSHLPPTSGQRAQTLYRIPARWIERLKTVELPQGATSVRLTDRPPEGPRMAVR